MKSNDWLILGLLGIGAYVLFGKKGAASEGGGGGGGSGWGDMASILPKGVPINTVLKSSSFQGSQFRVIGTVDRPMLQTAGALTPPTLITYNQNLLKQPMALQGITWKSGTAPQRRPDQYWK